MDLRMTWPRYYRQISNISRTKSQILVSSCSCLCPIHWRQLSSREWRCSWSSADRRCSNYIWAINNFIADWGATYIRGFTVTHLPPGQNGRHSGRRNFKFIFLNENDRISIQFSLKFSPRSPIDNKPALIQIMAWSRTGDKPLAEPMRTQFTVAYMRHWRELTLVVLILFLGNLKCICIFFNFPTLGLRRYMRYSLRLFCMFYTKDDGDFT